MLRDRLFDHANRMARQLGRKVLLGDQKFIVTGYISNIIDLDTVHEQEVSIAIKRVLDRKGTFVDVGANLGQTLGKVLKIDPQRSYLGFEPQIGACHYIERFIKDNSLTSAQVLPIGLSDTNELKSFWASGEADTMASLFGEISGKPQSIIQTRRGDEVMSELGVTQVAAIKIDVEGAELQVLHGFKRTIADHQPPLIFEVIPNFRGSESIPISEDEAEHNRLKANAIFNFLSSLNYSIFQLNQHGDEIEIASFELDRPDVFLGTNFIARTGKN